MQPWGPVARCGLRKRTPGTFVSETSWHRAARYRRASGTGRWVRAGRAHLAGNTELRSTYTHLPAGARVRVPRALLPAGSGSGPCAALRADTRGFIAPTTAARSLRTRTRGPGLLCYPRQTCLTRPASCSTLPSTSLQSGYAPIEPAACRARGRPPRTGAASSWVSACSRL